MSKPNKKDVKAIAKLRSSYEFRDEEKVTRFLLDNPFLIPVLEEAPGKIKRFFPDSGSSVADVVSDPDKPAGSAG